MSDGPLVSIIVPVYNAERYLARTLDSLISQTLGEIEILCVNDGSTDKSSEILTHYGRKSALVTVFNQENAGPGAARNTALKNAAGKYVLFCDADDTMEPECAAECAAAMEESGADIVMFNALITEEGGSEPSKKNVRGEYITTVNAGNKGKLSRAGCFKAAVLATSWGYCYRTARIRDINLYFKHYSILEDGIFLFSYLMFAKYGFAVDKKLYHYYIHKGSLTETAFGSFAWFGRIYRVWRMLFDTLLFAVKNKVPVRALYVPYALWMWVCGRRFPR